MTEQVESQEGSGPVLEMNGVRVDDTFIRKGQAYDGLLLEYEKLLCIVARLLRGEFPASAMTVDLATMTWRVTVTPPAVQVEQAEPGRA